MSQMLCRGGGVHNRQGANRETNEPGADDKVHEGQQLCRLQAKAKKARQIMRDMEWRTTALIAGIVMVFFIGAWVGLHLSLLVAHGYNLTEQQKQEERFLPYCLYNIKIVIEAHY